MTSLALSLAVCLGLGVLLDRALFGSAARGIIESFGRGLMLGMGAVGALSMLMDAFGLGVSRTTVGGAVAVSAVVAFLVLAVRRQPLRVSPPEVDTSLKDASPAARGCHAALLVMAFVGLGIAVRSSWLRATFQFDAITRWMFKTKALHFDQTLVSPVSLDPAFAFTHQRYPPLVSHVANLPGLVSGVFDDRIASAMFPWFAVAMACVVYGAVRRRAGPLSAALGAAWIGNLPLISWIVAPPPGAGAASAMADIPLGLFVTGAVLGAADALDGRRDRAHLEAGLLLGFATLTKNEGLPFVATLGLGVLLCAPRARWRRAAGVAAVGTLVFFVCWGRLASTFPSLDENYPGQLRWEVITAGFARLGLILPKLGEQLVDFRSWGATWLAVAAMVALGARSLRKPAMRMILVVVVAQIGTYVFAYMITAWSSPAAEETIKKAGVDDPLAVLIILTMGRLLIHVAPSAIALGLLASPLPLRRSG